MVERVRNLYREDRDLEALAGYEKKVYGADPEDRKIIEALRRSKPVDTDSDTGVKRSKREILEEVAYAKRVDEEDRKNAAKAEASDNTDLRAIISAIVAEELLEREKLAKQAEENENNEITDEDIDDIIDRAHARQAAKEQKKAEAAERKLAREKARYAREDARLDARDAREAARAEAKAEKERKDNEKPINERILKELELVKAELDKEIEEAEAAEAELAKATEREEESTPEFAGETAESAERTDGDEKAEPEFATESVAEGEEAGSSDKTESEEAVESVRESEEHAEATESSGVSESETESAESEESVSESAAERGIPVFASDVSDSDGAETEAVEVENAVAEAEESAETPVVSETKPEHDIPVFEDDVPLAIHEIIYGNEPTDEDKTEKQIKRERAQTEKALYLATSEAEDRKNREEKEMIKAARLDAKEARDIDKLIRKSQNDLDAGVEEAEILLAAHKAEKQRLKDERRGTSDVVAEDGTTSRRGAPVFESEYSEDSDRWEDPGIEEAAVLLEVAKNEKAGRAELRRLRKENPPIEVKIEKEKREDPGVEEAATLLAINEAHKNRKKPPVEREYDDSKESQQQKRADDEAKAMVYGGEYAPKLDDEGALAIMQKTRDEQAKAEAEAEAKKAKKLAKEQSTPKGQLKKNSELEALAIVYGPEYAKRVMEDPDSVKEKKPEEPIVVYSDPEHKEIKPKTKEELEEEQRKRDEERRKRAEFQALSIVYGPEYAKRVFAKREALEEEKRRAAEAETTEKTAETVESVEETKETAKSKRAEKKAAKKAKKNAKKAENEEVITEEVVTEEVETEETTSEEVKAETVETTVEETKETVTEETVTEETVTEETVTEEAEVESEETAETEKSEKRIPEFKDSEENTESKEENTYYPDVDADGEDVVSEKDERLVAEITKATEIAEPEEVTEESESEPEKAQVAEETEEKHYPDIDVDGKPIVEDDAAEDEEAEHVEKEETSEEDVDDLEEEIEKDAEYEALAVVYGEDYAERKKRKDAKKTAKNAKAEEETVYPDPEAYVAPEKPVEKKAAPAKEDKSPEAYEAHKSKKQLKKEALEELEAFYEADQAERRAAKEDRKADKSKAKEETVYPDPEAYVAPEKPVEEKTAPVKEDKSPEAYEAHKSKKQLKKEALEELEAFYEADQAERRAAKEDRKADRAKAKAKEKEVEYPDFTEEYVAPEEPVKVTEEKAPKEISTEAYDERNEKKQLKQAEKSALQEIYEADRAKRAEDKALDKEQRKAAKTAVADEPVYGDDPYDEEYNPEHVPTKAELREAAKAQKREEKANELEAKEQEKLLDQIDDYEDSEEKKLEKQKEKEALLLVSDADKAKRREDRALDKEQRKAEKSAPVAKKPSYGDDPYDEVYESEDALTKKELRKEAKMAERDARYSARMDAKEAKAADDVEEYEIHEEQALLDKEKKQDLLDTAEAERKARKEGAASEKSDDDVSSEHVYGDEPYDEVYAREQEPSKHALRKEEREGKRESKAAERDEAAIAAYDKKNQRASVAAALIAFYNADKLDQKNAMAEAAKSEKGPEEAVYPDADLDVGYAPVTPEMIAEEKYRAKVEQDEENLELLTVFDNRRFEGYDREQELLETVKLDDDLEYAKRERAKAEYARLHPETVYADEAYTGYDSRIDYEQEAKDARRAEKQSAKNAKREEAYRKSVAKDDELMSAYGEHLDGKLTKKEKLEEIDAIYAGDLAERKEARAAEKAERKAQKNAPKPEYSDGVYEEEYIPTPTEREQKKIDEAEAKAAAKAEKRAEKAANAEESAVSAYNKYNEEKLLDKEEAEAAEAAYAAERAARKEAKAAARAEAEAKKNAPKPEYSDGVYEEEYVPTPTEREQKKIDAAEAKAAAKAERKADKAQKKEDDALAGYDAAMEKASDRKAKKEELESLYDADRAEKITAAQRDAQSKSVPEEIVYPDADLDVGYTPVTPEMIAEEKYRIKREQDEENLELLSVFDNRRLEGYDREQELLETAKLADDLDYVKRERAKAEYARLHPETVYADEAYTGYDSRVDYKQEAKDARRAEKQSVKDAKRQDAYQKAVAVDDELMAAYGESLDSKQAKKEAAEEMAALYASDRLAHKEARAAEKAERKAEKNAPKPEKEYSDGVYEEEYVPTPTAREQEKLDKAAAKEAAKAEKRDSREAEREAKATERVNEQTAAYDKHLDDKITAKEEREELAAVYAAESAERKAARAEAKAERKAEKNAPKPEKEYSDGVYEEEYVPTPTAREQEKLDKAAAKEAAKAEKRDSREAEREAKATERVNEQTAAYDKHLDDKITAKEEREELAAVYAAESAERKAARAEAKAERKAEKNAPKPEKEYSDGVYEEEYVPTPTAREQEKLDKAAAKEAAKAEKRATIEEEIVEAKKHVDDDDIETYEAHNRTVEFREEEKKQLLEDAKPQAKSEYVYPDLDDGVGEKDIDILNSIGSAGDVQDGAGITLVGASDVRRAIREDKQLGLLIDRDRRRAKKAMFDMETLELAEKYSTGATLELADEEQVKRDDEFYQREKADKKAVKAYERDIEGRELIAFKDEHDAKLRTAKRKMAKADKAGKFTLMYGASYDPEFDGEFNNYGLPEEHPYTEGIKLANARGRRRIARREKLSSFDNKKLSELSKLQAEADVEMIEARIRYQHTVLELDVFKSEWQFSHEYEARKEKKWRSNGKKKLKHLKAKLASAVAYEKMDNRRYYTVVGTNFDSVELPPKADRDDLIAMREELMRLLDIRDDLNAKLLELYTGTENGMKKGTSLKGRERAEIKARKRGYRKYRKLYKLINSMRVTRNEKMRIFNKMDQYLDTRGELAKIKYILRNERPTGKVLREYKRDKRKAKSDLRILRRVIDRTSIKALRRAKKRTIRKRVMTISYAILILLVLGICILTAFGPQVFEAIKGNLPPAMVPIVEALLGGGKS